MFFEYARLLGMGAEPEFSFEFISRIILIMLLVLAMVLIGYKIKGNVGAAVAFLLCAFFFLYINGLIPPLSF